MTNLCMICNKKFEFTAKADNMPLLGKISGFLEETLRAGKFPLRYAITDVKKGVMLKGVTVLEEMMS